MTEEIDKEYLGTHAFGIPVTDNFAKFMKLSFTPIEFRDARINNDEVNISKHRVEINRALRSTPPVLLHQVRSSYAKTDEYPLSDTPFYNNVYHDATYGQMFPKWYDYEYAEEEFIYRNNYESEDFTVFFFWKDEEIKHIVYQCKDKRMFKAGEREEAFEYAKSNPDLWQSGYPTQDPSLVRTKRTSPFRES